MVTFRVEEGAEEDAVRVDEDEALVDDDARVEDDPLVEVDTLIEEDPLVDDEALRTGDDDPPTVDELRLVEETSVDLTTEDA